MPNNLENIMSIIDIIEITEDNSIFIDGVLQFSKRQKEYNTWIYPARLFGSNNTRNQLNGGLSNQLTNLIYDQFYIKGNINSHIDDPNSFLTNGFQARQAKFMDQIEKEINTTFIGDPFWKVIDINEGVIYISKNGLTFPVKPHEYSLHTPHHRLDIGSYVHLNKPVSDRSIQDFFFYVFGNKRLSDELDILRFYFNMNPEYVHILVNRLTTILNEYEVPFTFKCLNEAGLYNRADNCVLYIDMRFHSVLQNLLPKIYSSIAEYLKEVVPLFTLKLAPGLGLAEDPGAGRSFGLDRCKLLADLILDAKMSKVKLTSKYIFEALDIRGLQIENLHLRPYSSMQYHFPI